MVSKDNSRLEGMRPELFMDGKIRLIQGHQLAEYVLEFHDKLPSHLSNIFKIVEADYTKGARLT